MMRALLIGAGLLSLGLAILGLLLPLLPTTPFLLLAAGCFSRASTRMHAWMLRLPFVGRVIDEYESQGGLSRRSRRSALILLWAGIGASAVVLASSSGLVLLLAGVAVGASVMILKLPGAKDLGLDADQDVA